MKRIYLVLINQLINIFVVNAWTITSTVNPNRSIINGSFVGELDVTPPDTTELTSRVEQLEREVKGRDAEIRQLTERVC